jgi:hypothetical protein
MNGHNGTQSMMRTSIPTFAVFETTGVIASKKTLMSSGPGAKNIGKPQMHTSSGLERKMVTLSEKNKLMQAGRK